MRPWRRERAADCEPIQGETDTSEEVIVKAIQYVQAPKNCLYAHSACVASSLAVEQIHLLIADGRCVYEPYFHLGGRQNPKEMNRRTLRRGKVFVVVSWFKECRHAVMNRVHEFVWFPCENREGPFPVVRLRVPP
jgi:hypothetical protein